MKLLGTRVGQHKDSNCSCFAITFARAAPPPEGVGSTCAWLMSYVNPNGPNIMIGEGSVK